MLFFVNLLSYVYIFIVNIMLYFSKAIMPFDMWWYLYNIVL